MHSPASNFPDSFFVSPDNGRCSVSIKRTSFLESSSVPFIITQVNRIAEWLSKEFGSDKLELQLSCCVTFGELQNLSKTVCTCEIVIIGFISAVSFLYRLNKMLKRCT